MWLWIFSLYVSHREQLGYIVWSGVARSQDQMRIIFVVQSTRSPDYLDGRIEAFINTVEVSVKKYNRLLNIFKKLFKRFLLLYLSYPALKPIIKTNSLQALCILRPWLRSMFIFCWNPSVIRSQGIWNCYFSSDYRISLLL